MSNSNLRFLTTKDVAEILQISLPTARKLFKKKNFPKIPGIKKGLVEYETFIKYITREEYKIKGEN